MKNTLRLNHVDRTIVMDRTFARYAMDTRSDEYANLQRVRLDYPNYTLYKWNCGAMRFSLDNIDKLLLYFQEHEPARLERAEKMYDAWRSIE